MMIIMSKVLAILVLLFAFGVGLAYAEPLDETNVTTLNLNGTSTTVEMTWNHDDGVAKYKIGCVSCMPNITEFTSENSIRLDDITSFPNTTNAMLYIIAYDVNDEIIHAKQLLVSLKQ